MAAPPVKRPGTSAPPAGSRPSAAGDATRPVPPPSSKSPGSSSPAESAAARAVANGGTNARSSVPSRPGSGQSGPQSSGNGSSGPAAKSASVPAGLRPLSASPAAPPRPSPTSPPRPTSQPRPSGPTPGAESWPDSSGQGRPNGRPEQGGAAFQTQQQDDRSLDADAPRVARLTVASIDVWSALKVSFLLSVAAAIALVVAVSVLWMVLSAMGVFDSVNDMLNGLGLDSSDEAFDINQYIGFGKVLSISIVLGAVNAFILTALSTVAVLLYNLSSGLVGGVRVTLSDD